jgi:voltage-gated potassium channel
MVGDHRQASLRRQVYIALEGGRAGGTAGLIVETVLVALIVLNLLVYTLQSVPWIDAEHHAELLMFEYVTVGVFTLEYLARLWTAVEDPGLARRGAIGARLRVIGRPLMLVDLLSIAPTYIALFFPMFDLRVLRMVRLLRLLKIARYSPALSTLAQVLYEERRALFGTLLLLLCATMFAAAAMHAVEGGVQPRLFGTIPDSMWWAITTLTTVGYGDAIPITSLGRMIAGLTMITGLGLFALPVGIIATGFVEIIHRKDFVVTFGMLARVPVFQEFDAATLAEIMSMLRAQAVPPHGIISAEGERAQAMYFIVSGQVRAELPGHTLTFAAGDFFGEMALLTETMRAATITAVGQTRLLALSTGDFERLLRKHAGLKDRLTLLIAERAENIAEESGIRQAEIDAARRAREEARHTA